MNGAILLGADNRAALRRLAETLALPHLQPGWVWLAGAGPGDPGLASLHTLYAIAEADVVLIDALVNKALLALARPDVRIIDAGKRGGRPSPSQDSISRRLISYARKHPVPDRARRDGRDRRSCLCRDTGNPSRYQPGGHFHHRKRRQRRGTR